MAQPMHLTHRTPEGHASKTSGSGAEPRSFTPFLPFPPLSIDGKGNGKRLDLRDVNGLVECDP